MQYYEQLWKAVIRPPRAEYKVQDLGPKQFSLFGTEIIRTDLEIKNSRGLTMQCSHFEPLESTREWETLPCVIYLHANASCRVEALDLVDKLLP